MSFCVFQRVFFGRVEPASVHDANCSCGCIWTREPPRDFQKWFLLAFCAAAFIFACFFGPSRHTQFRSLFPPHPFIVAPPGTCRPLPRPLFIHPSHLLIIFHTSGLWASKNCTQIRRFCRLFFVNNFSEAFLLMPSLAGLLCRPSGGTRIHKPPD